MVDNVFTFHTSLIPFAEHNDGARMQMAASQIRQQLQYDSPDIPTVMTGYEDYILDLYRWKLDKSGTVVYVDNFLIIIQTDDSETYNIYVPFTDKVVVENGQRIEKGTLLTIPKGFVTAYSVNGKDNEYYLSYGKNLLTCVLNSSYGYEDAYYISESCKEKLKGYIPDTIEIVLSPNEELSILDNGSYLYEVGSTVNKGSILASVRNKVNDRVTNYYAPHNYVVEDVVVVVNRDKMLVDFDPGYRAFLAKFLITKTKPSLDYPVVGNTYGIYAKHLSNNDKKEWSVVIRYFLKQVIEPDLGNKITNRHAGKGVISKIDNDKNVGYCSEFNAYCDIYLSPMSIISRMNVGTFFEMLASKLSYYVKRNIEELVKLGTPLDTIKMYVYNFYDKLYNETGVHNEILEVVSKELQKVTDVNMFSNFIPFIFAPPMNSPTMDKLLLMLEEYQPEPVYLVRSLITTDNDKIFSVYTEKVDVTDENRDMIIKSMMKTFGIDKDTTTNLVSNEDVLKLHPSMSVITAKRGTDTYHYIAFTSYLYYMALVHVSENKLTARSVGRLSKKYLTPERRYDRKDTGQRVGEMESLCVLSHGCESVLYEFMTSYSDDIHKKVDIVFSNLYGTVVDTSGDKTESGTVQILNSYVKFLSGFELSDITKYITDVENTDELISLDSEEEVEEDEIYE